MPPPSTLALSGILISLLLYFLAGVAEFDSGTSWRYIQGFLIVLSVLTTVYVNAWLYVREARDAELREKRYQEEREEKRREKEEMRLRDERKEEEKRLRDERKEEAKRLRDLKKDEDRRRENEEMRQRHQAEMEARRLESEQRAEMLRLLREGQEPRVFYEREVQFPDGTWARERGARIGNDRNSELFPIAENRLEELRRFLREKRTAIIQHVNDLRAIADAVDKFHKGAAIANVTGASVSAAGGIITIVGLALSPFTLGTSLILSAVGTGIAIAGGVTRVASGVSETRSNLLDKRHVENVLRSCSEDINEVCAALENYVNYILSEVRIQDQERLLNELESMRRRFFNVAGVGVGNEFNDDTMALVKNIMRSVLMLITSLLDDLIRAVATGAARSGAQAAAGAAAKATGIVGALFLPLDAYDIYKNSKDIHRGAKTEIASRIREIADRIQSIIDGPPQRQVHMVDPARPSGRALTG